MASTATVTTLVLQCRAATMPATSSISFMVTPVEHTQARDFRTVQSLQLHASVAGDVHKLKKRAQILGLQDMVYGVDLKRWHLAREHVHITCITITDPLLL